MTIVTSIIKSYQGKNIRVNPVTRYVCLTDMAKAIDQVDIERFLSSTRLLTIKGLLYERQSGIIQHPIQVEDDLIWIHMVLAQEFSHQLVYGSISQSKGAIKFAVFLDGIFWGDIFHPEVLPSLIEKVFCASVEPKHIDTLISQISSNCLGYVYFMLNTTRNQVKIGHSKNPDCRLTSFQCATTDKWVEIGRVVGTKTDEKNYHEQFSILRVEGKKELFYYGKELKSFMQGDSIFLPNA